MKQSSTLVIATVLLLATSGVALAQRVTAEDVECDPVFKAKATAGKTMSSEQLARDLKMPIEKVNACLLRLRTHPPAATPQAAQ